MIKIIRKTLSSSRVKSAGYDPISNILEIEFQSNGTIYHYYNVPENEAKNFFSASSHGKYVEKLTRNYRYKPVN